MWTANNISRRLYPLVLLAGLGLAGCTTGLSTDNTPALSGPARPVHVESDSTTMTQAIAQAMADKGGLKAVSEDDTAQYILTVQGSQASESVSSLGAPPHIVGILRQEKRPTYYTLSYRLLDATGMPLAEGDAVGLGEDHKAMFPSLPPSTQNPPPGALADAAKQVVNKVTAAIRATPVLSKVVAQDTAHGNVLIVADGSSPLKIGSRFSVAGAPETRLELTGFIKVADGTSRAVLKCVAGPLPGIGTLIRLLGGNSSHIAAHKKKNPRA